MKTFSSPAFPETTVLFFLASVYYYTGLSLIVKMLNHDAENFRKITRSSLDLDMRKRVESNEKNNFFGHEVNEQNSDVKQNG